MTDEQPASRSFGQAVVVPREVAGLKAIAGRVLDGIGGLVIILIVGIMPRQPVEIVFGLASPRLQLLARSGIQITGLLQNANQRPPCQHPGRVMPATDALGAVADPPPGLGLPRHRSVESPINSGPLRPP